MEENITITGIGAPVTKVCKLYVFRYSFPSWPGLAYVFENIYGGTISNCHSQDKVNARFLKDLYFYMKSCPKVHLLFEVPEEWGKEHKELIPEKLKKELELDIRNELFYLSAFDEEKTESSINLFETNL